MVGFTPVHVERHVSLADTGDPVLQTHSAFGPALQCIFLIMNGIGGKLLVFQSAPPSVGVGECYEWMNCATASNGCSHASGS
jgi:Sec23/Sec24 trunk domain